MFLFPEVTMKRLYFTFCCAFLLTAIPSVSAGADGKLRAGAAAVDVTPKEFPLNMPGGFSANLAMSAHDPLHARALVLDDGTTTLAVVVLDNLGAPPEVLDEAKEMAAKSTGILAERMLICSTHTHSGPPSNAKEDYRCTVTVMSGLPGSGKDSWLSRNRGNLPIVSLDDIRVELDIEATGNQGQVIQAARDRSRELLRAGRSFAFNATNLLWQTRKRWIDLCADYGARIEVIYVEPPFATILAQNKRRERPVPEGVVRELAHKCEPPTWTEPHDLVIA
jgi:predicted kinase